MMHNWPEYGIGLALLPSNRIGDKDEISCLTEKMGFEDPDDLVVNKKEHDGHVWRYYDEDWDGKSFHPLNGADSEEPDEMLVIWAKRQPDPFKAAYMGPGEIREEFRELVGKYLPENFDWDSHIGEFSCSLYC